MIIFWQQLCFKVPNVKDLEGMKKWLAIDEKISLYATDSFMGDYKYYSSNPIDEKLHYQYKMNKNGTHVLLNRKSVV